MQKVLAFHAGILKQIQIKIGEKLGIRSEDIRPVNISISDESTMTFQLSFIYPFSEPEKNILLDFEITDRSPHTLYFETLNGLKGFEASNQYHGLENEVLKYINFEKDQ